MGLISSLIIKIGEREKGGGGGEYLLSPILYINLIFGETLLECRANMDTLIPLLSSPFSTLIFHNKYVQPDDGYF